MQLRLMSAWGANPAHKDLFVEVDYTPKADKVALNAASMREMAAVYAAGPGEQLQNPDGLPGVNVHLDVAKSPSDPDDATLHGDWGGSNEVPAELCTNASNKHGLGDL